MLNLAAHPRRAPWVEEIETDRENTVVFDSRSETKHQLNASAKLIWDACSGEKSLAEVADQLASAFPDSGAVKAEVVEYVQQLVDSEVLVLDGGNEALEFQGEVVRHLRPTAELLWQLELVRQFVFGCTRIEEAATLPTDLEDALGPQALAIAKERDVDSARQNSDSAVITYKAAMRGNSFKKSMRKIVEELKFMLPDVEADIILSGNSIYPRGAHMGWHSNHTRSDGRVYCTWAERGESNYFRYEDPLTGKIVTQWEQPGWNIKSFTIPPKTSRFWHCIGASSLRFSLGFRYELPNQS